MTNIQNGVLFQYNSTASIYASPANTRKVKVPGVGAIVNGIKYVGGTQVPMTRTCSINVAFSTVRNMASRINTLEMIFIRFGNILPSSTWATRYAEIVCG